MRNGVTPLCTATPALRSAEVNSMPFISMSGRAASAGKARRRRLKAEVSSTASTLAPAFTYCEATR